MGPEKYSEEQRQAVMWACLDRSPRLTYRQCVAAAKAGELRSDVGPFEIPYNTVAAYARDEKRKRLARALVELSEANPDKFITESWQLLAKQHLKHLQAADRENWEPRQIQQLLKNQADIEDLIRKRTKAGTVNPDTQPNGTDSGDRPDWIKQLEAEATKPKRSEAPTTQQSS